MRTATVRTTLGALCLIPAVTASTGARRPALTLQPESRLWVDGTSTVRSFSCAASALDASVETTAPGAASAVMQGEKAVRAATLTVPAERLDCRNGTMNEHMRKALKVEEHPTITFRVASYELSAVGATTTGSATGALTLGGVEKPITVTGGVTRDASGALRIAGSHRLRMTEYGIKPPSLMMGTMKVRDEVTVHFDLLLKG